MRDCLNTLTDVDLIALKNSAEFRNFIAFYFLLIQVVEYQGADLTAWLQTYNHVAAAFPRRGVTVDAFLRTFRLLCKALGKEPRRFSRPLEVLLRRYELTNRLTINDFIEKLQELADRLGGSRHRVFSSKTSPDMNELSMIQAAFRVETNITIGEVIMGDKYEIHGQAGAIGPGAQVHDVTFNQVWNEVADHIDLTRLASELSLLPALKVEQSEPLHESTLSAVDKAQVAASEGNGPKAMQYLSKASKWALDVATKIGVSVATDVPTKAIWIGDLN